MTAIISAVKGRSVLYLECRMTENLCRRLGQAAPHRYYRRCCGCHKYIFQIGTISFVYLSSDVFGCTGFLRSFILASSGVLSLFFWLHFLQQVTKFVHVFSPPLERGITWSIVNSLDLYSVLQYWQVLLSLQITLEREGFMPLLMNLTIFFNTITDGILKVTEGEEISSSYSSTAVALPTIHITSASRQSITPIGL